MQPLMRWGRSARRSTMSSFASLCAAALVFALIVVDIHCGAPSDAHCRGAVEVRPLLDREAKRPVEHELHGAGDGPYGPDTGSDRSRMHISCGPTRCRWCRRRRRGSRLAVTKRLATRAAPPSPARRKTAESITGPVLFTTFDLTSTGPAASQIADVDPCPPVWVVRHPLTT